MDARREKSLRDDVWAVEVSLVPHALLFLSSNDDYRRSSPLSVNSSPFSRHLHVVPRRCACRSYSTTPLVPSPASPSACRLLRLFS